MEYLNPELVKVITMYAAIGIIVLGVLGFVVSMVTQAIKNVGKLQGIATNIVVLVLSIVVTLTTFFGTMQYFNIPILWYYVFSAVLLGCFVAVIATNGWKFVFEAWNKVRGDISELEWNKQAEEYQKMIEEMNRKDEEQDKAGE